MKKLIFSQDNSIEPNGAIGLQKWGIIFWQKTGFLRHCNELGFQSIITLINKKFLPTNIQNYGDTCFIQFDNDDNKFVDCAFAGGADFIVSEDAHFNVLKSLPFPTFNVVTMDEFLKKCLP